MFAICMAGLNSTLSKTEPKWKLDQSLIGTNPGMGFRPIADETARGSVIEFASSKVNETNYWISEMNKFMDSKLNF